MKEETCMKKGFNSVIFWKDGWEGVTSGQVVPYRTFKLNQFLRKLEEECDENVVGIQFEENNLIILVQNQMEAEQKLEATNAAEPDDGIIA